VIEMKVLLVYPPDSYLAGEEYFVHRSPPLGLAYIAALLEKAGHDVEVIDCVIENWRQRIWEDDCYHVGLSWNEMRSRIKQVEPDIVGISCMFSCQFRNAQKTARLVKEVDPNIPVVVGGAHPSGAPSLVMKDPDFDFVIIGEGEYSMLSLVNCLEEGGSLDVVQGLVFRENDVLKINPRKHFPRDLDVLPFPARHLFPIKEYLVLSADYKMNGISAKRIPFTTMITSRGCPNRCVFCVIHKVWGRFWRARSPRNVVDEIELLVDKYKIREIHFQDDNLTLDKNRMRNICREILNRGVDISWTTPNGVHVNTLDEDLLQIMKRSGCYRLFLGIESGNPYILNSIVEKGLSLARVREVVKLIKRLDMETVGFFVLGLPGETKDTMKDTVEFAKSLDLDHAQFSIATPYPGTDLYDQCKSMGYLKNEDLSKLWVGCANISTDAFSSEDVQKVCDNAKREFELHKLVKHPRKLFSRNELRKICKYFLRDTRLQR